MNSVRWLGKEIARSFSNGRTEFSVPVWRFREIAERARFSGVPKTIEKVIYEMKSQEFVVDGDLRFRID